MIIVCSVLSPLSASAKLTMTTRPGEDINIPQVTIL